MNQTDRREQRKKKRKIASAKVLYLRAGLRCPIERPVMCATKRIKGLGI
jgi:hypothetical protein